MAAARALSLLALCHLACAGAGAAPHIIFDLSGTVPVCDQCLGYLTVSVGWECGGGAGTQSCCEGLYKGRSERRSLVIVSNRFESDTTEI